MNDYNFEVAEKRVQVAGGKTIPNLKAIIRVDNGEILSTVSNRYRIVTHEDVVSRFETTLDSLGGSFNNREVITFLPKNGARMLRKYIFPEIRMNVGKNNSDEFDLTLELRNSYDGCFKVGYEFGAYRLLCLNGMFTGEKFQSIMKKHFESISIENMITNLKECPEIFERQLQQWGTWKEDKIRNEDVDIILKEIDIPNKIQKQISDRFLQEEQSKYGLFNAVTNVITHSIRAKKDESNSRLNQLNLEEKFKPFFYR